MIEIKYRILPLIFMVVLSGCRVSNPASPTPGMTITQSSSSEISSQTPLPSPSSSPTLPPTPRPKTTMTSPSAPPGLIYCSDESLWAIQEDGIHIFLVPDCRATFSSDYRYVFFYRGLGEYLIVDLESGETISKLDLWDEENDSVGVDALTIYSIIWSSDNETIFCNAGRFGDWFQDIWSIDVKSGIFTNLTNTEDRIERKPYLFDNHKIVFSSFYFDEDTHIHPYFSGYLTVMNEDGSGYSAYQDFENGEFDVSPDGSIAAIFGGDLFSIDTGFTKLEPTILNKDQGLVYQMVYPSWSLDNKYISWSVETTQNDQYVTGFGIYDVELDTIELFYPFSQLDGEGPPFPPEWSPDGEWLLLRTISMESHNWGVHVLNLKGEEIGFFKNIQNVVWNSSSTKMILNSGHVSSIGNGVWIAELNDLEPISLDLPEDAVVLHWIDPEVVQSWFGNDS